MLGDVTALRLPKLVEGDPRATRVHAALAGASAPLWARSELRVAEMAMSDAIARALRAAADAGQLVRGLEGAERSLANAARGQRLADEARGEARGERVSRILLLSNDGAERFYRNAETLLRRHGGSVLALRVALDADALGALAFGPEATARAVLLDHKEAVAAVLFALAVDEAPFPS